MNKEQILLRLRYVCLEDRILLFKRLSLFLRAGIPILEALRFTEEDTSAVYGRHVIRQLSLRTASGRTLSESLSEFPALFDSFCISLVRIGETSGSLAETLAGCAEHLRKKDILQKKIVSALIYPALIVFATLGIASFLTLYAFPKMLPVLRGFKHTLPFTTRILIAISDLVIHHGVLILTILILSIVVFIFALRYPKIRFYIEGLLIAVPVFGRIQKAHSIALSTRTLSVLLKSGIAIVLALELSAASSNNLHFRDALMKIKYGVARGARLSDGFRKHPRLFALNIAQLTRAGEATGTLSQNLSILSDLYEQDLDDITRTLTTLIEPLLMILMGFIVGFIALAIITPIYSVTQNLGIH